MAGMALERNLWLTTPMMRGDDVLALQRRLAQAGATITQDGLFGRGTRAEVEKFQRNQSLKVDGIVGIATWTKLIDPAGRGAAVVAPSQAAEMIDPVALATPHRFVMDGSAWSVGPEGVMVAGGAHPLLPDERERAMVARVFADYAQDLTTVLTKVAVPVELVVACICTESGGRPDAKRMEPGCDRADPARTPTRVSWGLMQTLLSTAREAVRHLELRLEELLQPGVSIRAGATYMWNQARLTGFDPPLVAAAYNAGSLYRNDGAANHWKLRQYPIGTAEHVDRFCRFFNAAMAEEAPRLGPGVPRMRDILRAPAPARGAQPLAAAAPVESEPNGLTMEQFRERLHAAGVYTGPVDGPAGPGIQDAIEARFAHEAAAGKLAPGWESWTTTRRKFAVEQSLIRDSGIEIGDIDGLVGQQTMFAREAFQHLLATGQALRLPERDVEAEPAEAVPEQAQQWPRQADCERFYGQVGLNQTLLVLPYSMRLAWDLTTEISRFSCHEKVHDAFLRVLTKTLSEYGETRIRQLHLDLFGGCLNVRLMRGGTRMSMHSWGIAIDLDPLRNALRMTHTTAAFARPEYAPFWKIVEGEGLISLGRMRDFDWMHFQAARF